MSGGQWSFFIESALIQTDPALNGGAIEPRDVIKWQRSHQVAKEPSSGNVLNRQQPPRKQKVTLLLDFLRGATASILREFLPD